MPSKNKARGNAAERAFVKLAEDYNLEARRAWGSDGRAMGEHEEVDVVIEGAVPVKVQVKRRKKLSDIYIPNDNVDVQALYQDGAGSKKTEMYFVVPARRFMELLWEEVDYVDLQAEHQILKAELGLD